MLVRYMATNEISEHAADKNVRGKMSAVGDACRRHESRQAVSSRWHPRAVAMSFRDHRREGPGSRRVARRKRVSAREELTVGTVNAHPAAGLRRPGALGYNLQDLDDD